MVMEKQLALFQAWTAACGQVFQWQQQAALALLTGASPRKHSAQGQQMASRLAAATIAPVHRKVTANAKRLARTKLR